MAVLLPGRLISWLNSYFYRHHTARLYFCKEHVIFHLLKVWWSYIKWHPCIKTEQIQSISNSIILGTKLCSKDTQQLPDKATKLCVKKLYITSAELFCFNLHSINCSGISFPFHLLLVSNKGNILRSSHQTWEVPYCSVELYELYLHSKYNPVALPMLLSNDAVIMWCH